MCEMALAKRVAQLENQVARIDGPIGAVDPWLAAFNARSDRMMRRLDVLDRHLRIGFVLMFAAQASTLLAIALVVALR